MLFGCSEREYQRGDEIAWYADGDKIVRNEYHPATAYAFGIFHFDFFFFLRFRGELMEEMRFIVGNWR